MCDPTSMPISEKHLLLLHGGLTGVQIPTLLLWSALFVEPKLAFRDEAVLLFLSLVGLSLLASFAALVLYFLNPQPGPQRVSLVAGAFALIFNVFGFLWCIGLGVNVWM